MLKKLSITLSSIALLTACGDNAQEAPYGTWESPISAELTTESAVGLRSVRIDGDDLYWIESRLEEGGRRAIVKRDGDGNIADAIPADYSSRTRVHEYGGGSYFVDNRVIYFSNHKDQKLYRYNGEGEPEALTSDG